MATKGIRNGTWTTKACLNCKIVFAKSSPQTKFCCRACYNEFYQIGSRIHLVCKQCGKDIYRIKSHANIKTNFCSWVCTALYKQEHRQKYTCFLCQKIFYSANKNRVACSQKCSRAAATHKAIETTGRVNITSARNYLRRLNNSCWRCGYKENVGILQVHHKNRNHSDNTKDNIILLCPNCHEIDHFNKRDGRYKGFTKEALSKAQATRKAKFLAKTSGVS